MDDRLDTEIRRQIGIAVSYSTDPENVQAHLDSWADRHIRARVRIVDFDEGCDDEADNLIRGFEMRYAEPKPVRLRQAQRSTLVDWVATFVVVVLFVSAAVLVAGASVGLAKWMGGVF